MSAAVAWLVDSVVLLVGGAVSLFIAFLIAYGFVDEVSTVHHVVFLGLLAGSIVVCGLVLGLIDAPLLKVPFRQGLRFGLAVSASLHLLALAIGTVVSLSYEDQGSVTADQPDAPFVVLVVAAGVLAALAAWASTRVACVRSTLPT